MPSAWMKKRCACSGHIFCNNQQHSPKRSGPTRGTISAAANWLARNPILNCSSRLSKRYQTGGRTDSEAAVWDPYQRERKDDQAHGSINSRICCCCDFCLISPRPVKGQRRRSAKRPWIPAGSFSAGCVTSLVDEQRKRSTTSPPSPTAKTIRRIYASSWRRCWKLIQGLLPNSARCCLLTPKAVAYVPEI